NLLAAPVGETDVLDDVIVCYGFGFRGGCHIASLPGGGGGALPLARATDGCNKEVRISLFCPGNIGGPKQQESMDFGPFPSIQSLSGLREAEAGCTRCPLYKSATQVVPGEGRVGARLMLVGEQPGDKEDLAGRPFVGPAGRILDPALDEAGIARGDAF